MTERGGEAASALTAARTALLARRNALASVDRALAAVVADAHVTTLDARKRLDRIESEIDALVRDQDELALDTPGGARAAQRLLTEKMREIAEVVATAAADADAKRAVVEELLAHYGPGSAH